MVPLVTVSTPARAAQSAHHSADGACKSHVVHPAHLQFRSTTVLWLSRQKGMTAADY
jgi:hypothetical protein